MDTILCLGTANRGVRGGGGGRVQGLSKTTFVWHGRRKQLNGVAYNSKLSGATLYIPCGVATIQAIGPTDTRILYRVQAWSISRSTRSIRIQSVHGRKNSVCKYQFSELMAGKPRQKIKHFVMDIWKRMTNTCFIICFCFHIVSGVCFLGECQTNNKHAYIDICVVCVAAASTCCQQCDTWFGRIFMHILDV